MRIISTILVAIAVSALLGGAASAAENTPSKVVQVRLGNLVATDEMSGTVTFELTDASGETQSARRESQAGAGEPLEGLAATFSYQGSFRWTIHTADANGRQLSHLEGEFPGYPYSVAAPLSSRLQVASPEDSVVFLEFVSFMLELEAIAVLKDREGLERVHATAGLDSNGSNIFDAKEEVSTEAKPEHRLVRVTVPRLSSSVNVASFFIRLTTPPRTGVSQH